MKFFSFKSVRNKVVITFSGVDHVVDLVDCAVPVTSRHCSRNKKIEFHGRANSMEIRNYGELGSAAFLS